MARPKRLTYYLGDMTDSDVAAHRRQSQWMASFFLCAGLTLSSLTLAAQQHEAVSWVPYQIGCPVLVTDLRIKSDAATPRLFSIEVQNVSADAVEEITVGLVAGGPARRLVAARTLAVRMAPGERQWLEFSFPSRAEGPAAVPPGDVLTTIGAVRVQERAGSVWVSPVTIDGEFRHARWSASEQARERRGCQDDRRRLYVPGAVIFDERHAARICQPDGTWAPR